MSARSTIATNLSSLLRRCCQLSAIKPGQQTHTQILTRNLIMDSTLQTDLLLMYSRCSHLNTAQQLFDKMPHRTMHAWNILISSYVQSSLYPQAFFLFSSLLSSNLTPDHFTLPPLFKVCAEMGYFYYGSGLHSWAFRLGLDVHVVVVTSILNMYVKFECMDDARKLFEEMHVMDVVVWNSMITGLAKVGSVDEAMSFFRRSQCEGREMDVMMVPSVLSVCGRGGELRSGKEVHGRVIRYLLFPHDVVVSNSLIEMYAKCGCPNDSYKVFSFMADSRNLISWSTMISCYGVHGKGKEALALYREMIEQGFKPNTITFTSILSSCSHTGLVDEGLKLFDSMTQAYGLEPSIEHYACVVDLLGRGGRIQDAQKLVQDMPVEPTGSIWGALLAAGAIHRNVEVAQLAARKLFELEPHNCSNYIALCGVYEMVGMWDKVAKTRARMRELGMVKTPGCSWIHIDERMHAFYQGHVYVPSSKRVSGVLDGLGKIMAVRSITEFSHEMDGIECL